MNSRHLACLGLLLAAASSCVGGARAAAAAGACPPLLSIVESLPESSIFAEILIALGAEDSLPSGPQVLPPADAPVARRRALLSRRGLEAVSCPMIYDPVCGKDNKTYSNDCVAGGSGAEVACLGECPCQVPGKPCPAIFLPVCGSDGISYDNKCVAEAKGATVECERECPCPLPGVPCPQNIKPVCGVDGDTYDNDCLAEAAGTTAACNGPCPCKPADKRCPTVFEPVCGVDGFTYESACAAEPTPVACEGPCPCAAPPPPRSDRVNATRAPGMCISLVDPVCGTDGESYPNSCEAAKYGADVQCKGSCPCPDLLEALQRAPGGMLLVPTDESLLEMLNATAPGDWLQDTPLLRRLLARHVILTQNQGGKRFPKPTLTGIGAITEAQQMVRLYSSNKQSQPRVVPEGPWGAGEPIQVLDFATGCHLIVQQIEAPLEGS